MPSMVEISSMVLEKKNVVNVFLISRYYLPLETGRTFHLNKVESASPKDALSQVWFKLALWLWRIRFLKNSLMYFRYFCYYLPLEKDRIFHLNKNESHSSKDALYQV